ncbi:MAG: flagellar hook-associated protein FlgL, partial [Thermodesulfovibrionales bacterium]|nr:flagellar hook-associated protein FlgL [Thermodesulfovibrionales bacterium]
MRVTTFMIYDQFIRSLQRNLTELSDSNEKLATGKRINKPSDDVVGISRSLDYKVSINLNSQFLRNIDEAMSHLSYTEMRLSLVSETLNRVKELTLLGVSDNIDPLGRRSIANEVKQLRDHLLSLANSKFRDRYVFSGYKTDTQSFNPSTYEYQGDDGYINVVIDKEAAAAINIPGIHIFGYSISTAEQIALNDGRFVHYIPGVGSTITVEIRDTDNSTVLDTFSFTNVI